MKSHDLLSVEGEAEAATRRHEALQFPEKKDKAVGWQEAGAWRRKEERRGAEGEARAGAMVVGGERWRLTSCHHGSWV